MGQLTLIGRPRRGVLAAATLLLASLPVSAPVQADGWFQDPGTSSPAPAAAPVAVADAPVAVADAAPLASGPLPITGLRIPSVAIETPVVEAPLIEDPDGSVSWDVPKFVAGHAEATGAGAGANGNAVVFGHVSSLTLGNVFENLYRAHVGDEVHVFSGDTMFTYRVVDVASLSRTDTSMVNPSERPVVTLVTCTGLWNPLLHDYMQRLVVRAELPT